MIFHAKENITPLLFYVELNHLPPRFLGYPISLPTYCPEKGFLLPEIHIINFSFILKFISSSFLLNMNLPFVQSSCFNNNFFVS